MSKPFRDVVVLGGSASGLLAAKAIAEHAERVILVERDALPDEAEHRKGTPQSRHANNLAPRALPSLERFHRGIVAELVREGATEVDEELRAYIGGLRLARCSSGAPFIVLSRPLLDKVLRQRLR